MLLFSKGLRSPLPQKLIINTTIYLSYNCTLQGTARNFSHSLAQLAME